MSTLLQDDLLRIWSQLLSPVLWGGASLPSGLTGPQGEGSRVLKGPWVCPLTSVDAARCSPGASRSGFSWSPSVVTAACALSPQCSPWPDVAYQVNSAPSPSYNGSPNSFGLGEGYV